MSVPPRPPYSSGHEIPAQPLSNLSRCQAFASASFFSSSSGPHSATIAEGATLSAGIGGALASRKRRAAVRNSASDGES